MNAIATPSVVFVEVTADEAIEPARTNINKQTGMSSLMPARQTVWLWIGKRHPVEMKVDVDDKVGPLRPGTYLLGGPIFGAGEWGRPTFLGTRNLELIPIADAFASLMDGVIPDAPPKVAAVK